MGTISVRVVPRSTRAAVEVGGDHVTLRVHAPAQDGRATEEARRALAAAVDVAPSRVTLRSGARSRRKVFDVQGMTSEVVRRRLGGG